MLTLYSCCFCLLFKRAGRSSLSALIVLFLFRQTCCNVIVCISEHWCMPCRLVVCCHVVCPTYTNKIAKRKQTRLHLTWKIPRMQALFGGIYYWISCDTDKHTKRAPCMPHATTYDTHTTLLRTRVFHSHRLDVSQARKVREWLARESWHSPINQ